MSDAAAESADAVAGVAADGLLATERGERRGGGGRLGGEDRIARLERPGRIGNRGRTVNPLLTADVIRVGRRRENAMIGRGKRRRLVEVVVVVAVVVVIVVVDGGMNGVFLNLFCIIGRDREKGS